MTGIKNGLHLLVHFGIIASKNNILNKYLQIKLTNEKKNWNQTKIMNRLILQTDSYVRSHNISNYIYWVTRQITNNRLNKNPNSICFFTK